MAVSEANKQIVRDRCAGACQIFHRHPTLEGGMTVHSTHQGSGGMPEDHEVNQPKKLLYGCQHCHDLIDGRLGNGLYRFGEVDLEADPPILELFDPNGRRIPERELWLFASRQREELAEVLDTLRGVQMIEGAHAAAMLALFDDYDLLTPEAGDPYDMFGDQGFDPDHAIRECEAAKWLQSHDLTWPPGLPLGKLRYFSESAQKRLWAALDHDEIQALMEDSINMPKSQIKEKLKELGVKTDQPFFYAIFDPEIVGADVTPGKLFVVRARDRKKLVEASKREGRVVMQVQAWRAGWTFEKGRNAGLFAEDGTEIPYEDLDEVGYENSLLLNRREEE